MGFVSDLGDGKGFEKDVSGWIRDVMGIDAKENANKKGVDIVSDNVNVEVKYDRMMRRTGNLFLEFECNKKPSGMFKDEEAGLLVYGDYESAFVFRLSDLREEFSNLIDKFKIANGGDGWRSKGLLLPIDEARKISQGEIFIKKNHDSKRKEKEPQEP